MVIITAGVRKGNIVRDSSIQCIGVCIGYMYIKTNIVSIDNFSIHLIFNLFTLLLS